MAGEDNITHLESISEDDDPYKLMSATDHGHGGTSYPSTKMPTADQNNIRSKLSWLERNAPTSTIPPALLGTGTFAGGIIRDYKLRYTSTLLKSDFIDGLTLKTKSASLFMFCATMTSTVALGEVAFRETDGHVGITEYLMLQGASGVAHSLFSACPMPILRPTGPITAFMVDLYKLSSDFGVE